MAWSSPAHTGSLSHDGCADWQVIGVVVSNAYGKRGTLTIDTNVAAYAKGSRLPKSDATKEEITYDWAIWCHGYSFSNYEKLNAKHVHSGSNH